MTATVTSINGTETIQTLNMPTVKVQVRNVYGVDKVYPVCENAHRFAQIAGTKTLSAKDLQLILDLGFALIHTHPAAKIDGFSF